VAHTLQTMLDERLVALVGRGRERAALLDLVERDTPIVAFVQGIAGVGKTTLLRAAAADARARGAAVVTLDGRTFEPTERGFLTALGDALDGHDGRVVLCIDAHERLRLLDAWLRQELVPGLPENVRVVIGQTLSVDNKLRLYRTFMYATTEVKDGLPAAQRQQLNDAIIGQFPSQDERVNRELALMLGYAGQPAAISKILAAIPKTSTNQELQLHYLYALRMIKTGWTTADKTELAEVLGRAAKWRGGAQFINFVGQFFDALSDLYASDAEKTLLYEKAPDFSPLTPDELVQIQARQAAAAAGRGGRGGGGGGGGRGAGPAAPLAARTAGRVLSRQEMFEETVYQPQQVLDVDAGRKTFEANCASCHKFGSVGNDNGVAALNLSASPLRSSKAALLEAVFFPNRKLAADHETTVLDLSDGKTISGLVVKDAGGTLTLLTPAGTTTDVPKAQVKGQKKAKESIMPDTLADTIDRNSMRNLAAFLVAAAPQ